MSSALQLITQTTIDQHKAAAQKLQDCTLRPLLNTNASVNNTQIRLPPCRGLLFDAHVSAARMKDVPLAIVGCRDPTKAPGVVFVVHSAESPHQEPGGTYRDFFQPASGIKVSLINFATEGDLHRHLLNRAHLGFPRLVIDWPGVSQVHQLHTLEINLSAAAPRNAVLQELVKSVWVAVTNFTKSHARQIQAKGIVLKTLAQCLRLAELRLINDTTWHAVMKYRPLGN